MSCISSNAGRMVLVWAETIRFSRLGGPGVRTGCGSMVLRSEPLWLKESQEDWMQKLGRRTFAQTVLATSAAYLFLPRSVKAADSRIEILINEPIGTIAPETYSHFIEHLGGVIYDGIWVGEKSKIPNYNGIRKSLVDNLKKLKPGVIRYPGGCFADQYDWRDGVGSRDKRPTRVNFWADTHYKTTKNYEALDSGPQKYEPNWFGTDDFINLCKLVGAKPYLAANLR